MSQTAVADPHAALGPLEIAHIITRCPICGGALRPHCVKHAFKTEWRLERCESCGHGLIVNRPTLEALGRYYSAGQTNNATSVDWWTDPQRLIGRAPHELIDGICRRTRLRGRSLDIGAGGGQYSYAAYLRGFKSMLNDFDPAVMRAVPHVPGSAGHVGSFESMEDRGPYDAIIMSQVLEHALDPMSWLRSAYGLLSPGGVLAIALPNFGGVYRLLGARDPYIAPPGHLNHFTGRSLARALRQAGFVPAGCDSISCLPGSERPGLAGMARKVWNPITRGLDRTTLGVILRGYGVKPG